MDNQEVKQNLSNGQQWLRIIYMILFVIVLYLVSMLVGVVMLVQALFSLLTGKPNEEVADFASDLTRYVYQVVCFLTYQSEERPFPFSPWEKESDDDDDYMTSVEDMGDARPDSDKKDT
jgi:hypothetical protein